MNLSIQHFQSLSSILKVYLRPVVNLSESVEEGVAGRGVLLVPERLQGSGHLRRVVVKLWVVRVYLSLS